MTPLEAACPPGYDLCGVYSDGWASRSSWECVNTHSNLESCPFFFLICIWFHELLIIPLYFSQAEVVLPLVSFPDFFPP